MVQHGLWIEAQGMLTVFDAKSSHVTKHNYSLLEWFLSVSFQWMIDYFSGDHRLLSQRSLGLTGRITAECTFVILSINDNKQAER